MNKILITGLLFGLIILTPLCVMAQGGPPKTPIDGGLSLLLAAGGLYGVKKVRDMQQRQD